MRVEPKRLRRLGNGQLLVERDGTALRSVAINGNQWQSMAPTWYGSLRALIVGFGLMGMAINGNQWHPPGTARSGRSLWDSARWATEAEPSLR